MKKKHFIGILLLAAVALIWWSAKSFNFFDENTCNPNAYDPITEIPAAQVIRISATERYTVGGETIASAEYSIENTPSRAGEFDYILGKLDGTLYTRDLRNLLPFPKRTVSCGPNQSFTIYLETGSGTIEVAKVNDTTLAVRQPGQTSYRFYRPRAGGANDVFALVKEYGAKTNYKSY